MPESSDTTSSRKFPASARIIQPGRNCWKIARADRLSVLVDGQSYYAALREAIKRARRSIVILAWDVDPRIELLRDDPGDGYPTALGELIVDVLRRRSRLRARVLEWDFAMIYAVEREWVPLFDKPRWPRHRRLQFRFDGNHPLGASHHQKVVVVDDRVAFVGGMDVAKWRWDSTRHAAADPRRIDPAAKPYPPYHDVQVVVDGDAARVMGQLARDRWRRAVGGKVRRSRTVTDHDPWPVDLDPHFRDVDVAIARTDPAHDGRPEVREVERLTLDAIDSARESIYIENQFLTSAAVCEALEKRLAEQDGPEVVIVLPHKRTSWLEEYSMGAMRSRCLRRIRAADRSGRLRVYYPHVPELDEQVMNVHSKLIVVDGTFLRIGSSNLSNRSMGLDTECDIAVEAGDREDLRDGIRGLRRHLLAHLLDVEDGRVGVALKRHGRLGPAIEELRTDEHRSLAPLDGLIDERIEHALPESTFFDPERPLAPERVLEEAADEDRRKSAGLRVVLGGLVIAAMTALAVAWRWTSLADWVRPELLADRLGDAAGTGWGFVLIPLGFALASIVGIPVSVLVVAVALAFDGWSAVGYAWVGCTAGALGAYALGRVLGRDLVRRLAGKRLNKLGRILSRHGLVAVITLRVVPVAPFSVVNLVMGVSQIRLRHYVLGTAVGMLPGILAIALFVERIMDAIRQASAESWLIAIGAGLVLAAGLLGLRWFLTRGSAARTGAGDA